MFKNEHDHLLRKLFSDFELVKGDILVGSCPEEIKNELSNIVDEMYKIKNSPLHWIRTINTNVAGNVNKRYYIPPSLLSNTMFSYFLREYGRHYLNVKYPDHNFKIGINSLTDPLYVDIWMNFYENGNSTSLHDHGAILSGIVFCSTNDKPTPTTFENGVNIFGNFGDICIFPSKLQHENAIYLGEDDRITISFNLAVERNDQK